MRTTARLALAAALVAIAATPALAQQPAKGTHSAPNIMADLRADLAQAEQKIMSLARAIPADKYNWRPAEGVRSVGEVLLHIAADNYLLPAMLGHAADPATGIKGDDYTSVQAYERRQLDREATIAELEHSFAHLKKAVDATPTSSLGDEVSLFGQKFTTQRTWILTATHLHEHLGQLIAYARSNGIAPPWSRGG